MTKLVKQSLALVAMASLLVTFVGCGEDPAPVGNPGTGTGDQDTIYAMTVIHPDGWSASIDSEAITPSSMAAVTGGIGEDAVLQLDRVAKPDPLTYDDPWPYGEMIGFMTQVATNNLAKMKTVEIEYTINSIETGADGVSFAITSNYETGIPAAGYARFHAVLTAGGATPVVATRITDTLELADFFISYAAVAGVDGATMDIPEGTTLADPIGTAFLLSANAVTFAIEDEGYDTPSALNLTVHDIKVMGDAGLKSDMGITD